MCFQTSSRPFSLPRYLGTPVKHAIKFRQYVSDADGAMLHHQLTDGAFMFSASFLDDGQVPCFTSPPASK